MPQNMRCAWLATLLVELPIVAGPLEWPRARLYSRETSLADILGCLVDGIINAESGNRGFLSGPL
jgi:hypothetical protein